MYGHETIKTPMVIGQNTWDLLRKWGRVSTNENWRKGDRRRHLACGHCRNCRRGKEHVCENTVGIGVNIDGAFAEYVRIPSTNVVPLDHRIPDDWAAIMDPFGNATHTALSFPLLGEDVLITGAGLIGSMASGNSKIFRCKIHCGNDLSDFRLDIAKKMGATLTINPSRENKISDAVKLLGMRGFDVGLEMSGSPRHLYEMISNMYNGSSISLLGLLPSNFEIPWNEIIF
jgi:threonine 3-dehydrogenase